MSTVAERIAALNAKKKVEEPPPLTQRKSIKWQKPAAIETKQDSPAPPVLSQPKVASPQGGGKLTPSWLKGGMSTTASAPKNIPFTKATSPTTSPHPSPSGSPSYEQSSSFPKVPTVDKDSKSVMGEIAQDKPKEQPQKEIPVVASPVPVVFTPPEKLVEASPQTQEEDKPVQPPAPVQEQAPESVVQAKEPEEQSTPELVQDPASEPILPPVVAAPPLPPSRKPSFTEAQAAQEVATATMKVEVMEGGEAALPALSKCMEEKVAESSANVETPEGENKASEEPLQMDRSSSSSSSVVNENKNLEDDDLDIPPPPREEAHEMLGSQTLESRRSVRFGVGEEVKVEEFDYDDLIPTEDDPPTPASNDDAIRSRRRSSLSQKVVSILKRASRGGAASDGAKKNGISWG